MNTHNKEKKETKRDVKYFFMFEYSLTVAKSIDIVKIKSDIHLTFTIWFSLSYANFSKFTCRWKTETLLCYLILFSNMCQCGWITFSTSYIELGRKIRKAKYNYSLKIWELCHCIAGIYFYTLRLNVTLCGPFSPKDNHY